MSYREPPVSVSTAHRQLVEAMSHDSIADIEEAARWLAFHLERDESPDPSDVIGAIDKVAELEREIGRRRQNTFRAIASVAVVVGLTVTLLTNLLFGICAALVSYLLLDNFVLRKMPSFVGVELLLRDAAHQRWRFLRRQDRRVRVAERAEAHEESEATQDTASAATDPSLR